MSLRRQTPAPRPPGPPTPNSSERERRLPSGSGKRCYFAIPACSPFDLTLSRANPQATVYRAGHSRRVGCSVELDDIRRRDREPKPVGIPEAEYAQAVRPGDGWRIKRPTASLNAGSDRVHILLDRNLKRKPVAFDAIESLRPIICGEKKPYRTGPHRDSDQVSAALVSAVDGKTQRLRIPVDARFQIFDRERRFKASSRQFFVHIFSAI